MLTHKMEGKLYSSVTCSQLLNIEDGGHDILNGGVENFLQHFGFCVLVMIKCTFSYGEIKEFKRTLEVFNQPLFLLENVLEFAQSGLHFFQREVLFGLCTTILGHPGIEFVYGVVQKLPFFDQCVGLLHPFVRYNLDFVIPLETNKNRWNCWNREVACTILIKNFFAYRNKII